MKTVCVTFTCERDFEIARLTHEELPAEWNKVWCVSTEDAEKQCAEEGAVPEGVELLVCDFDRGFGLNGRGTAEREAEVFRELSERYDCVVKKDSDTVLFDACAFAEAIENGADYAGIKRYDWRGTPVCGGAVYAFSKRGAGSLPAEFDKDKSRRFCNGEDLIISNWFTSESGLAVKIFPHTSLCLMGEAPTSKENLAGHYGFGSREGVAERIAAHVQKWKELS